MTADYMTKPLQGKLFEKFRNEIMGVEMKVKRTWADIVKGHGRSSVPILNRNGRSVLESRNLLKNTKEIKKKSEKYPVKMG
jgi:hypothetical protein